MRMQSISSLFQGTWTNKKKQDWRSEEPGSVKLQFFGLAKNSQKWIVRRCPMFCGHPKLARWPQKSRFLGPTPNKIKQDSQRCCWTKSFIFMNYTRFKGIKREILLLLVLYLKKWVENWNQKYLYYKFLI